jgi:hypothetical protein
MRYDAQDMLYEDDKRLVGRFFLQESERETIKIGKRGQRLEVTLELRGYCIGMGDLHIFAMVRISRSFTISR